MCLLPLSLTAWASFASCAALSLASFSSMVGSKCTDSDNSSYSDRRMSAADSDDMLSQKAGSSCMVEVSIAHLSVVVVRLLLLHISPQSFAALLSVEAHPAILATTP